MGEEPSTGNGSSSSSSSNGSGSGGGLIATDTSHLTCIACRMVFDSLDAQRAHYKSPFHCFNLHRRSTNQPPVSEELFEEKVAALRAEKEAGEKNGRAMRRQQRRQQNQQHQQPKDPQQQQQQAAAAQAKFQVNLTVLENDFVNESRRKAAAAAAAEAEAAAAKAASRSSSAAEGKAAAAAAAAAAATEEELNEEELGEDAALDALIEERLRTAKAIPPTVSLFDGHESETVEENARYMETTYGDRKSVV